MQISSRIFLLVSSLVSASYIAPVAAAEDSSSWAVANGKLAVSQGLKTEFSTS